LFHIYSCKPVDKLVRITIPASTVGAERGGQLITHGQVGVSTSHQF